MGGGINNNFNVGQAIQTAETQTNTPAKLSAGQAETIIFQAMSNNISPDEVSKAFASAGPQIAQSYKDAKRDIANNAINVGDYPTLNKILDGEQDPRAFLHNVVADQLDNASPSKMMALVNAAGHMSQTHREEMRAQVIFSNSALNESDKATSYADAAEGSNLSVKSTELGGAALEYAKHHPAFVTALRDDVQAGKDPNGKKQELLQAIDNDYHQSVRDARQDVFGAFDSPNRMFTSYDKNDFKTAADWVNSMPPAQAKAFLDEISADMHKNQRAVGFSQFKAELNKDLQGYAQGAFDVHANGSNDDRMAKHDANKPSGQAGVGYDEAYVMYYAQHPSGIYELAHASNDAGQSIAQRAQQKYQHAMTGDTSYLAPPAKE